MKLIHQVLKKMHEHYAIFFPASDAITVQKLSVALVKNGFAKIPAEYVAFLQETDGLSYNGLELYGTQAHERNRGAFFHPSLVEIAERSKYNPILKGKVVIGTAPEVFIIFNPTANQYELISRYTQETLLQLPRFFDVLYHFCPDKK